MKPSWFWMLAVLATGATVLVALTAGMGLDYPGPPCLGCDYAGPPIDALLHLRAGQFFATQPLMGGFSLLLRWPAALIAEVFARGSLVWQYRLGALVCLLGPFCLALGLQRILERQGTRRLAQVVVVGLCVANPLTFAALHWGHPEEPLAGALCVGAVLLAGRRQPVWAGVALGLAFATKPWAWLALGPVLLAGRERRAATMGVAVAVGAVFVLPMLIGDPSRFIHQTAGIGVASYGATPFNIWWGYAHEGGALTVDGSTQSAFAISPTLGALTHPLVVVVAIGASLVLWRRHPAPEPARVLQLLAFVFLMRCLLDPLSIAFHHVPFFLALTAAEALAYPRRIPRISLAVALICWAMNHYLQASSPDLLSRVYLSWTLPLVLYLAYSWFARDPTRASPKQAPDLAANRA